MVRSIFPALSIGRRPKIENRGPKSIHVIDRIETTHNHGSPYLEPGYNFMIVPVSKGVCRHYPTLAGWYKYLKELRIPIQSYYLNESIEAQLPESLQIDLTNRIKNTVAEMVKKNLHNMFN